jgi:hypothetical protein
LAAAAQIDCETHNLPDRRFEAEFELLVAASSPGQDSALAARPITSSLDWKRALDSAEHHRVVPALNVAIASAHLPPQPAVRDRALNHAWRALQLTAQLARIAQHFRGSGIEFLAYKGPALAQLLYGNPAMRQFGDLDLLVRPQDVVPAQAALIELGYRPRLRLSPRQEQSYFRSACEYVFEFNTDPHLLELHWQIVPRFYSINFDMQAIFSRSQKITLDNLTVRTLGREDLMLALCVHAAKHEWSQLAMLRDIFALAQFGLDWQWTIFQARALGIFKIVQVSLLAAHNLFSPESSAPAQTGSLDVTAIASRVIQHLQRNREPNTECLGYFRRQLQIRERTRDRLRFLGRLATTPGVEEWKAVQIADRFSALYHCIRFARLMKKFWERPLGRFASREYERQP